MTNPLYAFLRELCERDPRLNIWLAAAAGINPKRTLESMAKSEDGRNLLVQYDEWLQSR